MPSWTARRRTRRPAKATSVSATEDRRGIVAVPRPRPRGEIDAVYDGAEPRGLPASKPAPVATSSTRSGTISPSSQGARDGLALVTGVNWRAQSVIRARRTSRSKNKECVVLVTTVSRHGSARRVGQGSEAAKGGGSRGVQLFKRMKSAPPRPSLVEGPGPGPPGLPPARRHGQPENRSRRVPTPGNRLNASALHRAGSTSTSRHAQPPHQARRLHAPHHDPHRRPAHPGAFADVIFNFGHLSGSTGKLEEGDSPTPPPRPTAARDMPRLSAEPATRSCSFDPDAGRARPSRSTSVSPPTASTTFEQLDPTAANSPLSTTSAAGVPAGEISPSTTSIWCALDSASTTIWSMASVIAGAVSSTTSSPACGTASPTTSSSAMPRPASPTSVVHVYVRPQGRTLSVRAAQHRPVPIQGGRHYQAGSSEPGPTMRPETAEAVFTAPATFKDGRSFDAGRR